MYQVDLEPGGDVIAISAPDQPPLRFHAIWLRDNAQDPATRDPANGQRLITLGEIAPSIKISTCDIEGNNLRLTFMPGGHETSFDLDWLVEHGYDTPPETEPGWIPGGITPWDRGSIGPVPTAKLTRLQSDPSCLKDWLEAVARFGFATTTGGPVRDQALIDLVALFGHVRETNYGRHFEVRTETNPTNLAFTGLKLQAHTDNPYRDPVPSLQILYCLESSAPGGENMVIDGFAAARRLKAENTRHFELLSRYCAGFDYKGAADVHLRARRPMIELAPDGQLIAIRFNNRSTAPLTSVPFDEMADYYAAYRHLNEIIDDPAMAVTFRLNPGDAFIVDNTRVLHARQAFAGTGSRWLQGCYADKDGLLSTLAVLERQCAAAAP